MSKQVSSETIIDAGPAMLYEALKALGKFDEQDTRKTIARKVLEALTIANQVEFNRRRQFTILECKNIGMEYHYTPPLVALAKAFVIWNRRIREEFPDASIAEYYLGFADGISIASAIDDTVPVGISEAMIDYCRIKNKIWESL